MTRTTTALGLVLVLAAHAPADNYTWRTATNGDWSEATKWNPDGTPGGSDSAAIALAGPYTVTATSNQSIDTLSLTGTNVALAIQTATLTVNTALTTAAGTTLRLNTGSIAGTGDVTVNGALDWSGGGFQDAGSVTVNGPATLNNGAVTGGRTVVFAGAAAWTGNGILVADASTFRVAAGGVLTATADTQMTAIGSAFDVRGTFAKTGGTGTLPVVGSSGGAAKVSGAVTVSSGTIRFNAVNNPVDVTDFLSGGVLSKGTWTVDGSGQAAALSFDGRAVAAIGANASVTLTGSQATFTDLQNHLTSVAGSLVVNGGQAFTPSTSSVGVTGTLRVAANSTFGAGVAVNSGGTLSGGGTAGGLVAVNTGGTLSPGNASASRITLGGGLDFNGGTYAAELNGTAAGTGYDQVRVTGGNIRLGTGVLDVTLGFAPTPADVFAVVWNDGATLTGQLANGTSGTATFNGTTYTYQISYTGSFNGTTMTSLITGGDDVVLYGFQVAPVPEPGTVLGVSALGLGLVGWARRRRQPRS